ncbi:MAG: precorrin-2 C(20)-methyltransferase, partial [Deltaproteobacteria bacterium]|nr:precorrin-2 C(20)-methyltransferase [Deltaproteobacteria bacterium]
MNGKRPEKGITGTFYGVGAGPGDPELMTLKAVRVLNSCPVIAAPRSAGDSSGDGQALAIVRKAVNLEHKEILELNLPMTRDAGLLSKSRIDAAGEITRRLKQGTDVAFVTLGDPMLYSTFGCLAALIKDGLEGAAVTSIPGITSFSAVASRLSIPLAEGGEKVAIAPVAYDTGEVSGLISSFDTVVLMKVNKAMDALVDMLSDMGLIHKAVFVKRIGWPDEEVVTD